MINAHARSELVPRNFSIKLTADYLRGKSNAINTVLSSSLSTFYSLFVEINTMFLYVWLAEEEFRIYPVILGNSCVVAPVKR
jgi:hypothetical protein